MNRYCEKCRKPRIHRKIKGLNLPQKIVGGSILLLCGLPPILSDEVFECNYCGNKASDE